MRCRGFYRLLPQLLALVIQAATILNKGGGGAFTPPPIVPAEVLRLAAKIRDRVAQELRFEGRERRDHRPSPRRLQAAPPGREVRPWLKC